MQTIELDEMLGFLKKTCSDFELLAVEIQFDKTYALHGTIISLYCSILELTESAIHLIDNKLTGVPILMRSVLEAYIDLLNLIQDAGYGYRLQINSLQDRIDLLEAAKSGNPWLKGLITPTIDADIIRFEDEKKKLVDAGFKWLSVKAKFSLQQMYQEYQSLYSIICWDSHNSLTALFRKHTDSKNNAFTLVLHKEPSSEYRIMYVGVSTELLIKATQEVHKFFNSPPKGKICGYSTEFYNLYKNHV